MRVAVIDIGTNTILLLIAEVSAAGELHVLEDMQVIARLGKSVDEHRVIGMNAFARCRQFLIDYKAKCSFHNVDRIIAIGTSALRDAVNREDFISEIESTTGIQIEILSGENEAIWTFAGALSGIDKNRERYAVVDIGGGSTELSYGTHEKVLEAQSLDIGCVRMTERFLHHSPPTESELSAFDQYVRNAVESFPRFDANVTALVGVAGTVTTLAALDRKLTTYSREAIASSTLKIMRILEFYQVMRTKSSSQLRQEMKVDPGRADIILAGVGILLAVMEANNSDHIIVSERGLRYGIALREAHRL